MTITTTLIHPAVICSPLMAFALMDTDWLGRSLFAVVMLPLAVGAFFVLYTVCKRPPSVDEEEA